MCCGWDSNETLPLMNASAEVCLPAWCQCIDWELYWPQLVLNWPWRGEERKYERKWGGVLMSKEQKVNGKRDEAQKGKNEVTRSWINSMDACICPFWEISKVLVLGKAVLKESLYYSLMKYPSQLWLYFSYLWLYVALMQLYFL